MAEWAASGYISAFARSSNSPNNLGFMPREYTLSTNGLIDAQGITRYGVALRIPSSFWASHPTATPSRITARVSIAFDSTDTTEAAFWSQGDGNWRLGVVMFCMPASALTDPEAVPTPAAIISKEWVMPRWPKTLEIGTDSTFNRRPYTEAASFAFMG